GLIRFEYPQRGPKSIHELGVPQTARLFFDGVGDDVRVAAELRRAEALFDARDVDSLVVMLSEGLPQNTVAVANYLAQVGDASAIGPLQKLSEAWPTSDYENPFAAAIRAIKERLQLQGPQPPGNEPGGPSAAETGPAVTTFTFKPKGVLSGLITDANTGEPVVGARIRIRKRRHYRTATDENGFYSFDKVDEGGDYIVRVHSPEHMWFGNWKDQPVVELRSGSNKVKHLALEPGCLIDVNVVDEQGKPIDGAQLYVSWTGQEYGRETGRDRSSVLTNDDGEATVGAFEPSNVPYLITAVHEDYAPGKFLAKLTDPQVIEYAEVAMQRGVQVQGYAHYADGVPAEGLSALAKPDWWNINQNNPMAPIDPNGYFTLEHIAPGSYTVYIYTPNPTGGGGTSRPVITTQLPLDDDLLVVEAPGESPTGSASISGTIIYAGSQEPRDIRVSVYSPIGGSASARVDGDKFTIGSLKAGLYRLRFSGGNIEGKVIPNVRAPSDDLEIELRCVGEPRLRGSVIRADTNEPIPQFRLRVGRAQRRDWRSFSSPTGQFDLEVAGPGVYQVQVVADGLAPAWSNDINTDEDEPVVVQLNNGGSIKGRVVNQANEPITDAKVIPLSLSCGPEPSAMHVFFTETGAVRTKAGKFIRENLPQGVETIKVTHPDYCFAVVEGIEIQQGRTTSVTVVLNKGAVVEGRVYDQEGKPQPNELLYFQDAPTYRYDRKLGRLASVVTDSNGFYRAEKLPESLCYVSRAKRDRMGVISATILPVRGKVTRLDLGGRDRVITGRILLDNQGLAETKMLLGDPFDPHALAFIYNATTGASGDFTFSGVPAGWYGLYYKLS
ncbi:MAG: carboxypeptidase regulatory-like domain-containing protein, partial [Planctomycetota bacterium]